MPKDPIPPYDEPTALVVKTRELLEQDNRSLPEIYKATGIPFYWLKSFRDNRYAKNPSVNRVVFLYEFLTGRKLEI